VADELGWLEVVGGLGRGVFDSLGPVVYATNKLTVRGYGLVRSSARRDSARRFGAFVGSLLVKLREGRTVNFSPSLLITDDDRALRETLRDVFQPRGFRTLLAADGEEALQIVERHEVHLVLIDMHMPRLTGLEAISRIKQFKSRLPCILISGQLDDDIRARADAFEVLAKPISFRQVTQTVAEALRLTYNWSGRLR
jgi:CheY-like chemotaxis protein